MGLSAAARLLPRVTHRPHRRLLTTAAAAGRGFGGSSRWGAAASAAAAAAAAAGVGLAALDAHPPPCQAAAMTANVPLAPRHRVVLTQWPALEDPENSITSIESVFEWAVAHGYDALEFSLDDFKKKFFPHAPAAEVVRRVQQCTARYNMPTIGALYHVPDGVTPEMGKRTHDDGTRFDLDLTESDFYPALREKLLYEKEIGLEYINFHIRLPPKYLNSGGEYRDDAAYHRLCAQRIERIQSLCFELGLNCYFETHMNMISEDPAGFVAIMEACPVYFEVNLDVSHYNYRQIKHGASKHLRTICARVGHTHQRMCRELGDLSADVPDPAQDWADKGLTWQAFESMRPALRGGLSSRAIGGESGPLHLRDTFGVCALELDAKLVPLYRHMAQHADREAGAPTSGAAATATATAGPGAGGGGAMSAAEAGLILTKHFGR